MQREALHLNEHGAARGPLANSCLLRELALPSPGSVVPSPALLGSLVKTGEKH